MLMNKNTDISLPLFVYGSGPFTAYVVADELIALEESGQIKTNFWLAYYFLDILSKNDLTSSAFPPEILLYFKGELALSYPIQPCISGFLDQEAYLNWCLTCAMKIQAIKGKEVNLKNFALLESNQTIDLYVNELNLETFLSAQEAFLLFSNICFESRGFSILRNKPYVNETFEKEALKLAIDIQFRSDKGSHSYLYESFFLDYFHYLLTHLKSGQINPETIFRLSGSGLIISLARFNEEARVFVLKKIIELIESFDSLSQNQKICYSILFFNSGSISHIPQFSSLLTFNRKRIRKLLLDYTKKFPRNIVGERMSQDFVAKRILGDDFALKFNRGT